MQSTLQFAIDVELSKESPGELKTFWVILYFALLSKVGSSFFLGREHCLGLAADMILYGFRTVVDYILRRFRTETMDK